MAFQPAKDAEPIPGYRFLEKLGTGGYGEVWKTTAPGGLTKAIKVVYGDMGGARAGQELKALERIKQVRHPFLLSLERFEIIDSQLFIVTELADACLMDRYQECRQEGMKGIPREELLGYIRDAADALDYMTETHGLQHLDIKPQNLLLVSGRVKVADFGLVKELVGTSVTATGGVTPIYATPEAFDGRVSRYSDQYSLAIVYQEMLTGVRPFPGITMMQLAAQHTSSPPMLQPLPPSDRPAIARALAKAPDQRFPSCQKMAEALLTGRLTSTTNPIITAELIARGKKSGSVPRVHTPPPPPTVAVNAPPVAPSERLLTPTVPGQQGSRPGSKLRTVADGLSPPLSRPSSVSAGPTRQTPLASDTPPPDMKAGLRPTLFVGVGGLACATLRHLRRRLHNHFGSLTKVPIFRLLLVDTDREEIRASRQGEGGEALEPNETLLAPLHLPEYYRAESKKLLRWLDRRWLYGIPRSLQTEGLRPLGRLALVDNASTLLSHLRDLLGQMTQPEAIDDTLAATGLTIRDTAPRVFLVASVAGGTGGGMLLSLAYALRQVLGELGQSARGLCGLLLHATNPKPSDQLMARINACATLTELSHFSQPNAPYPGDRDVGLERFGPGDAPFEDCYLIHLGEGLSQAAAVEATRNLAEYLFLDASPEGGAFLDRFRQETRTALSASSSDALLRAFGLTHIGSDGTGSATNDACRCCRRLAELWAGQLTGGKESKDRTIELEAEREALAQGLDEGALVEGLYAAIVKQLGESPESFLARLSTPESQGTSLAEAVQAALDKIDQHLGACAGPNESASLSRTPLTATVQQKASERATRMSAALVDWLLDLIETPGKRPPAAERGAAWIGQHLRGLTDRLRGELTVARNQAAALRQLLLTGKAGSKGSGIRWMGMGRAAEEAPSPGRKLTEYGKLRLREIALANALHIPAAVQERLNRFLPELAQCSQKLKQFVSQLRGKSDALELHGGGSDATPLPADVLRDFDKTIQTELLEPLGGFWSVFAGSHAIRRSVPRNPEKAANPSAPGRASISEEALKEELLSRARSFLRDALPERNAAQAFLDDHGSAEETRSALLRHLEAATPRLRGEGGQEHLLLGVPDGPAKADVLKCLVEAIPDLAITTVKSDEDMFLVYDGAGYPMGELITALVGPDAPNPELVQRVMTRLDVPWAFWSPAPV